MRDTFILIVLFSEQEGKLSAASFRSRLLDSPHGEQTAPSGDPLQFEKRGSLLCGVPTVSRVFPRFLLHFWIWRNQYAAAATTVPVCPCPPEFLVLLDPGHCRGWHVLFILRESFLSPQALFRFLLSPVGIVIEMRMELGR